MTDFQTYCWIAIGVTFTLTNCLNLYTYLKYTKKN